jgi:uncharacterized membrane protein YdjX (TVP38/TMEM64 family)/Fe-S oxidoreductase
MRDLHPLPLSTDFKNLPQRPDLLEQISLILTACIDCPKCVAECAFLNHYGTPKHIAATYDPIEKNWVSIAFECSLCGLCASVCPVGLNPADMFLEMRRKAVEDKTAPFHEHKTMLAYEKQGTSKRYSWYSLPENCHTVLFPGCTLPGTRPDTTIDLYEYLKKDDPDLGIVLDCCCKPSHDLGRQEFFQDMLSEMKSYLVDHGIKTIITACPNCYKVFNQYGNPLKVTSVYETLAASGIPKIAPSIKLPAISIHDPCVLRKETSIHDAVRQLADARGFRISEMPHSKENTLCCGEGGSVGFVSRKFSSKWGELRKKETNSQRLLTYCAGCAGSLNKVVPTDHILDSIFAPEALVSGKLKAAKAPLTYLNRIKIKRFLKKKHPATIMRERNFFAGKNTQKKPARYFVLILLTAAVIGMHFFDANRFLNQETLRQTVAAWGVFAPMVYMLIYAIAPALFIPGLPITIAGGILFGPFWGVVYSITGATTGACVAFLIARYIARDWVQNKLRNPRWKKLDQDVEKHGWKIVAFTRLVPMFPFNVLNYAFGLTSVRFLQYAVTSFICMLPACIAFIVFSSSFLDIIKGKISVEFIIGMLLIGIVSLIPVMVKKLS